MVRNSSSNSTNRRTYNLVSALEEVSDPHGDDAGVGEIGRGGAGGAADDHDGDDIEMGGTGIGTTQHRQQQQQQQQQQIGGGAGVRRGRRLPVLTRLARRGMQQQPYSRVAAGTADEDDDDDDRVEPSSAPPLADGGVSASAPLASSSSAPDAASLPDAALEKDADDNANNSEEEEIDGDDGSEEDGGEERISVTILDFAQSKFRMDVRPSWTVGKLKKAGATVHKVPIHLQRLIFRGKLLADTKTLEESGIDEEGAIIHLFPKPRVVISNQSAGAGGDGASCAGSAAANDDGDGGDDVESGSASAGGARVPTIVLDAEEAERRSQILVLGSSEYIEAQNNVKLFSFMLLVISSIELLNLLAIALGVPQDGAGGDGQQPGGGGGYPPYYEDDDIFPAGEDDDPFSGMSGNSSSAGGHNSSSWGGDDFQPNILYQPWGWANTFDLLLSLAGVYVALIGIQASNENTLRLAKIYLVGTFFVGVGWILFNFFITLEIDRAVEEEHKEHHPDDDRIPDMTDSELVKSAISVMVLPGMVWLMCCLRAFQFQRLLSDAEEEAEARIRAELERSRPAPEDENDINSTADDAADAPVAPPTDRRRHRRRAGGDGGETSATPSSNNFNDGEELVLQSNSAILA